MAWQLHDTQTHLVQSQQECNLLQNANRQLHAQLDMQSQQVIHAAQVDAERAWRSAEVCAQPLFALSRSASYHMLHHSDLCGRCCKLNCTMKRN